MKVNYSTAARTLSRTLAERTPKNEELIKFTQLEFIKSYQLQQRIMDQTCPNFFTLKPKSIKSFHKPIGADDFELQLYCQKPGCIHAVKDGQYKVRIPKKWLVAIAPYYNKMLKILKWIVPILQPAASKILDEDVMKETASDWRMLKDYINKLPEIQAKPDDYFFPELEGMYREIHIAEGAELRAIRNMLNIADKNHRWGGLERVVTPEGHILWLCKEHAREYK